MKKVLFVCLLATISIACRNEEQNSKSSLIIGKWKLNSNYKILKSTQQKTVVPFDDACSSNDTLEFTTNGVAIYSEFTSVNSKCVMTDEDRANYTFDSDLMKVTFVYGSDTDTEEVFSLTPNELIFKDYTVVLANGDTEIYYQVWKK